jgi:hypothetical protein
MFIIFFNFGLNFKLKFLAIYVVQKAFEFGESFSKPAKFLLSGFQRWRPLCCWISKKESLSERYLVGLKTREIASGRYSKALGPAVRNLVSIERRI